jgi:hypothetical protein
MISHAKENPTDSPLGMDKSQLGECGCVTSRAIGMYYTAAMDVSTVT